MSYIAALLLLVSTAVAQTPRPLTVTPVTRKIQYMAMKVSNFGVETPVDAVCGRFTEPDVQDSPNPIIADGTDIKIDIVVGWDGKVYSPLVMSTSKESANKAVLRTVGSWRFRPALCNGTPINTEASITFRR